MHEVSLGGVLSDYLTGETRARTTYEDLRQALARFLVEEHGYTRKQLLPRFAVEYSVGGEKHVREADIAVFSRSGDLLLLLMFCPGQVHTFQREAAALARLALPAPSPLAMVTDMREAELFSSWSCESLGTGLEALPCLGALEALARAHPCPPLTEDGRDKESRILHAYTGFLKNCCGECCALPESTT